MTELNSRTRMLRAIERNEVDHIPCCLMSFTALRKRCDEDLFRLVEAELAFGLDSMLFIPTIPSPQRPEHPHLRGLPVRFDPSVRIVESHSPGSAGSPTLLDRRYITPAGQLYCQVQTSDDWPHGSRVPFLDDYQVPRAIKPLITGQSDLPALQYLLTPPRSEDIAAFRAEVARARTFVQERGVLLAGGWGAGVDMAVWLCSLQPFMVALLQQPEFAGQLLEMIHRWNLERMRVVLSAPVDLYIRRAWYEGCDFVTPRSYRQLIQPLLKAEVDLCHSHGAKFGYICTSGVGPMLDLFLEAGIDVLIGVDPVQGTHTNLEAMKNRVGGRIALWGGVSGALTIERGDETQVRTATSEAMAALGPTGFILSPVDNLTVDQPQTWQNLEVFIDEWQQSWKVGLAPRSEAER